jgi:hypothetical protein
LYELSYVLKERIVFSERGETVKPHGTLPPPQCRIDVRRCGTATHPSLEAIFGLSFINRESFYLSDEYFFLSIEVFTNFIFDVIILASESQQPSSKRIHNLACKKVFLIFIAKCLSYKKMKKRIAAESSIH